MLFCADHLIFGTLRTLLLLRCTKVYARPLAPLGDFHLLFIASRPSNEEDPTMKVRGPAVDLRRAREL